MGQKRENSICDRAVEAVDCPRCGSLVGTVCVSKGNKPTTLHAARELAYIEKIGTAEFARRHYSHWKQ